jgi:phytoene dehydrogenase-like protein
VVDAVVVGGGMGGLAAAISLATAGNAVVLLEAAPTLGGKAGTATVDGVTFDTGPSVLTLPRGIEELFASAGEDWREHVTLRLLERPFRYVWPDGATLDIAATLEGTLDNVRAAWGAEARDELASFLQYARRIWDAVAPTFVYGPLRRSQAWSRRTARLAIRAPHRRVPHHGPGRARAGLRAAPARRCCSGTPRTTGPIRGRPRPRSTASPTSSSVSAGSGSAEG